MRIVTPVELKASMDRGDAPFVLDVREGSEFQICSLPGAVLIPMNTIAARTHELPRDREIVCQCHHGGRSARVAQFLESQGFKVANLDGGIDRWSREVDPTVSRY